MSDLPGLASIGSVLKATLPPPKGVVETAGHKPRKQAGCRSTRETIARNKSIKSGHCTKLKKVWYLWRKRMPRQFPQLFLPSLRVCYEFPKLHNISARP